MSKKIKHPEMIDHYFKELGIDTCSFIMKGDKDKIIYNYSNLNKDEYQFSKEGDIPTNYLTNKTL